MVLGTKILNYIWGLWTEIGGKFRNFLKEPKCVIFVSSRRSEELNDAVTDV